VKSIGFQGKFAMASDGEADGSGEVVGVDNGGEEEGCVGVGGEVAL